MNEEKTPLERVFHCIGLIDKALSVFDNRPDFRVECYESYEGKYSATVFMSIGNLQTSVTANSEKLEWAVAALAHQLEMGLGIGDVGEKMVMVDDEN